MRAPNPGHRRGRSGRPARAASLALLTGGALAAALVLGALRPTALGGRPAVAATPAPSVVQVVIEEPGVDGVASGVRNIRGFTYSSAAPIEIVEVSIDGVPIAIAPCCSARADVKAQIPAAPLDSGFSTIWNWALITDGPHTLSVHVADTSGNSNTVQRAIVVSNLQSPSLGAFLDDASLANATCARVVEDICCDDVLVRSPAGTQICDQVCWAWDRASQGLVFQSADCQPPVLATPTPTPRPSPTPSSTTASPTPTATSAPAVCGNGIVEGDEECDGADLDDFDCEGVIGGFAVAGPACTGSLGCTASCQFNVSACRCVCEEDVDCEAPPIDCSAVAGDVCILDGACKNGLCFTNVGNASQVSSICNGTDVGAEGTRVEENCL